MAHSRLLGSTLPGRDLRGFTFWACAGVVSVRALLRLAWSRWMICVLWGRLGRALLDGLVGGRIGLALNVGDAKKDAENGSQ